jgi:hypothetical protein
LEKREARSIDTALDDLANPNQPQKTRYARAVAISFTQHVITCRVNYLAYSAYISGKTRPPVGEVVENVFATPKEFYTRVFLDMPELRRAVKDRQIRAATPR